MGLFCRSDGHFSQVGWASFVGRMGIFRRPDGRFSQVGWALFIGRMGIFRRSAQKCRSDGQEDMPIRPTAVVGQMLQYSGWAIGRMGSRADQHYPENDRNLFVIPKIIINFPFQGLPKLIHLMIVRAVNGPQCKSRQYILTPLKYKSTIKIQTIN